MNSLTTTEPKGSSLVAAIVPQSITEVNQLAEMVASAGWAPESYRKTLPANATFEQKRSAPYDVPKIAVGIMQGLEIGLKPIQALQSIAVINGIPSVYGDAMLAIVYATGQVEDYSEVPVKDDKGVVTGYICTMKRKGRPTPTVAEFHLADANAAGLLSKKGPWTEYRARMLKFRARSFCLRDSFPDALKGLISAEEAQDVEVISVPTEQKAIPSGVTNKLAMFAEEAPIEDAVVEEVSEETEKQQPLTMGDDGLPDMPEDVYDEANSGESYKPMAVWLDQTLEALPEGKRQALFDKYAALISQCREASTRGKNIVAQMALKFGVVIAGGDA